MGMRVLSCTFQASKHLTNHGTYPLVMTSIAIEHDPSQWIFPFKIVIFHSYVKFPEGNKSQSQTGKLAVQQAWNTEDPHEFSECLHFHWRGTDFGVHFLVQCFHAVSKTWKVRKSSLDISFLKVVGKTVQGFNPRYQDMNFTSELTTS